MFHVLVDGVRLGGTGSGGGQFGSGARLIGELIGHEHVLRLDGSLGGGEFPACLAEFGGGVCGGIDTFGIGDGLLRGLQVGGGNGWRAGAGCGKNRARPGTAKRKRRRERARERGIHGDSLLMTMDGTRAESTREASVRVARPVVGAERT